MPKDAGSRRAPVPARYVLYLWWIEGLRGIRHSYRTQSRLTGTGRQPRARRPSSRPVSVARRDFASRLRPLQASLKRRLARADVLADMIRAVNSSLDPEKVAEALVARVSDWIPAPGWLVLAVDGGGRTRAMAASGLTPPLEAAAHAVGSWVIRSGELFAAANIAEDRRRRPTPRGRGGGGVPAGVPGADDRRARGHRSRARARPRPVLRRARSRRCSAGSSRARSRSRTRSACSGRRRCRSPTI